MFAFDIVTAITLPTDQVLSQLTLALFEDTGWYKVDYSMGQMSPFGHGRGCNFVYEDCIVDGQVPEWSEGFFCNTLLSDEEMTCDPNHQHITFCDLVDYDQLSFAVPPNRNQRYFPDHPVSLTKCCSMSFHRASFSFLTLLDVLIFIVIWWSHAHCRLLSTDIFSSSRLL